MWGGPGPSGLAIAGEVSGAVCIAADDHRSATESDRIASHHRPVRVIQYLHPHQLACVADRASIHRVVEVTVEIKGPASRSGPFHIIVRAIANDVHARGIGRNAFGQDRIISGSAYRPLFHPGQGVFYQ